MFKNISLKNAVSFYTGGVYTPGKVYIEKVNSMFDNNVYPVEWVYYITNVLKDAHKCTSSSFIQRLSWVTTNKVWESFLDFREHQKKSIPVSLETGREIIKLCKKLYSNPDIQNMAISKPLIWDIYLSEDKDYVPSNPLALTALVLGNREYGELTYLKQYLKNNLEELFID